MPFILRNKYKYKICKLNSPRYNALDDLWPPIVTLFGGSHLGNRAKSVQECLLILISLVAPYAPKVPTLPKKYLWEHLSIMMNSTDLLQHIIHIIINSRDIRRKTCVKWPLKKDKTKILMTNSSNMKVESIAECSPWSILQYFWPALRDNWSWKPIISLFESGHFTQFYCNIMKTLQVYHCRSLMLDWQRCRSMNTNH